jgi:hypothetical protein
LSYLFRNKGSKFSRFGDFGTIKQNRFGDFGIFWPNKFGDFGIIAYFCTRIQIKHVRDKDIQAEDI